MEPRKVRVEGFDTALIKEFFQALVNCAGLTLHLRVLDGENIHHIIEAIFKAFGRAIDEASQMPTGLKRFVPLRESFNAKKLKGYLLVNYDCLQKTPRYPIFLISVKAGIQV